MEAVNAVPGAARALVIASMVGAVGAGCWLLAAQGLSASALAGGAFLLCAVCARFSPIPTVWVVLALGGVHYGVLRLALGAPLAAVPVWLAAFSGFIVGVSAGRGWQSPSPWRVPLAWWATSAAVSWPIVFAREIDFAMDSPRVTATLVVPSALIQMAVALWMDWLMGAATSTDPVALPAPPVVLPSPPVALSAPVVLSPPGALSASPVALPTPTDVPASPVDPASPVPAPRPSRLLWPIIAGAAVSALAAFYQRFVDPAWMSGPPWSTLGRSAGLMGDANPLGVLVAICAPLAVVLLLWRERGGSSRGFGPEIGLEGSPPFAAGGTRADLARGKRGFGARLLVAVVVALLLWTAAWFSGARSMLLISAAGLGGLSIEWLRARLGPTRAWGAAAVAATVLLATLVALAPRATPGTPLGRLFEFLPKSSVGAGLYELLWRRDGYGLAAVQAITEHPLTGVGIGTFNWMSPAYFRELGGHAVPPDNAQNLWRQTLVERGVLGLIPILWLTGLIALAVWRCSAVAVSVLMAGIGATLFFGYPVQDATVAATIGLVIAWVVGSPSTRRGTARTQPPLSSLDGSTPLDSGGDDGARAQGTRRLGTGIPGGASGSRGFAVALVVSLVAAGIDVAGARGALRVPARSSRFGIPYSYGLGPQEQAPDGRTARSFRGEAVVVVPAARSQLELRGWVRSKEGDSEVRIWHEDKLVFNVSLPDGATFAQSIWVPPGGKSAWVRMTASRGDVLIIGSFEGIVVP